MSKAKIIGGEFKITPELLNGKCLNNLNPSYSLGRTCLFTILDSIHHQRTVVDTAVENKANQALEVLLPDYICLSIAEVPQRLGLKINHYHIKDDFSPDYDSIKEKASKCASIVLISYFGLINLDDCIKQIRAGFPHIAIVVDDVQNYYGFGNHIDYDYSFTSYRKWFCSPDGADVLIKGEKMPLKRYTAEAKYVEYKVSGNLLKNYADWINDSVALEEISKGEALMDEEYRYRCSEISVNILRRLKLAKIQIRRKQNAAYLHEKLDKYGLQHIYDPNKTPLFVPLLTQHRERIRKNLFSQNIFTPIHWPVQNPAIQGTNELYQTELSLICDQRYDEEDMERIIRGIENAV